MHEEGFSITGADGEVRFARPDQSVIETVPVEAAVRPARPLTEDPVVLHEAYDGAMPIDAVAMVA